MNIFNWKEREEIISLGKILDEDYVMFSAKSIDLDYEIETLYKNPKSFANMPLVFKYLSDKIDKNNKYPIYIESGNIMPLWLFYNAHKHHGVDYSIVESVEMGKDGYVKITALSSEDEEKYNAWARKMERKTDSLVDSSIIDDESKLCRSYEDLEVKAKIFGVEYCGPTRAITISEDMTIAQFQKMIKDEFNFIPILTRPNQYKEFPGNTRLSTLGFTGENTIQVKTKMRVGTFGHDFCKLTETKLIMLFKFVERPWAFMEDCYFDEVDILPSVFTSLKWDLLVKFGFKIGAFAK